MNESLSFQCLLRQGDTCIVAWIETRGARLRAHVELKDEQGLWEVAEVYQPPRTATWLNENARRSTKACIRRGDRDGCQSGNGTRC
jgi:hypothetical protein